MRATDLAHTAYCLPPEREEDHVSAPDDLVNVETAARELGLSRAAVTLAIRRGVLAAVEIDRRTRMIPRAEVERYRVEHLRKRGPGASRKPVE
jgi:excisionase family DNA binding protein